MKKKIIDCDYSIRKQELNHKKKMDEIDLLFKIIFSFYDRISPILIPFISEWLKLRQKQYFNSQKSWRDIINLKRIL